jgi:hypothetical protein
MKNITLYRPVGLREMELIVESNWQEFPPRLEWQPFFYPVLNQQYAEQIALDWNTKDEFSGFCGIVTAFDISESYFQKFKIQNVGGTVHNELWIPAEILHEFNAEMIGNIRIVNVFWGENFTFSTLSSLNIELQKFLKK